MNVILKQLEILHAIVVAGSISKATRMVGLSQPTLSQQLARFEEVLGTQLITRGRSATGRLTAAGEFWFRHASEVLDRLEKAELQHRLRFDDKNLALRFGTTPSLRGRFIEMAAQIAAELDQISRFDFVWAATSSEVVALMDTHNLNCGVISAASIEGHAASYHVEHLWRDRMVWTVPASLPDAVIAQALATGAPPTAGGEALMRYVEITTVIPWKDWSDNWFRHNLPFAAPFFGCMTHPAAIDIVAAGIATTLSPASLLRNLPAQVRARIKPVELGEHGRDVVLVMPRHLLSLTPFKTFCDRLADYSRKTYRDVDPADDDHPVAFGGRICPRRSDKPKTQGA